VLRGTSVCKRFHKGQWPLCAEYLVMFHIKQHVLKKHEKTLETRRPGAFIDIIAPQV